MIYAYLLGVASGVAIVFVWILARVAKRKPEPPR